MQPRSEHLQIRVRPQQEAALERRAAVAGQDLSTYVLSRAVPSVALVLQELIDQLGAAGDSRSILAALNDVLTALAPVEWRGAVEGLDAERLSRFTGNYLAAMVEQAAAVKGVQPPAWTSRILPLERPWFATSLSSLRLHLLRASPVPFRRRNIFIDSTIGARV